MPKTTVNQNINGDIIALAIDKINKEFESFAGGQKEVAVSSYMCSILEDFCRQDERFAKVVLEYKRTLSNCCKYVMKGVTSHISDIDAYRSAVQFYFPNAEISMSMQINILGDGPTAEEIMKTAKEIKPKKTPKAPSEAPIKTHTVAASPEKKKADNEIIQLSLF